MQNKFRDLGGGKKSSPIKKGLQVVETSRGIVDFTPTFEEHNQVSVLPTLVKYSRNLQSLRGKIVTVDYCKIADLGDMVVEVLYLKPTIKEVVNPYLVEHFKLV